MKESQKEWWETLFDDKYLKTYVDRITEEATASQLEFIMDTLALPPKATVLDLACGYGRLSLPLARKGYQVTAFDFSQHLLSIAEQEARAAGLALSFEQGDMRRLAFRDQFDAIINIFTSFGYFENSDNDLAVLRGVHRALKPEGRFLLDFANSPRAIGWLYQHAEVDESTGELVLEKNETLSNGLELKEIQRLNVGTLRWQLLRSWEEDGKERSYNTNVRMYFLAELRSLCEAAALDIERVYGDFDGSSYQADSNRILILARKS